MAFSTAVSRFFRAIRVHKAQENTSDHDYVARKGNPNRESALRGELLSVTEPTDSMIESNEPIGRIVLLPNGFMRQHQRLIERVEELRIASDTSNNDTNRQQKAVTKVMVRLQSMFLDQSNNDKKQSKSRKVSLFVAMHQVLSTWECIIKCLMCISQRSDSAASTCADRLSESSNESDHGVARKIQIERAACALLELLIQQPIFDIALMTLGRGECDSHHEGRGRKHSVELDERMTSRISVPVTLQRRNSRQSSRRETKLYIIPPKTHPSFARRIFFSSRKKGASLSSDATLCELTRQYLQLHQNTLVMFINKAILSDETCGDSTGRTSAASSTVSSHRPQNVVFLGHLLSVSYVRIPAIRDAILTAFQQHIGKRSRTIRLRRKTRTRKVSTAYRRRSSTLRDDANIALFRWHQMIHSRCHISMAPYSAYDGWCHEMELVTSALKNTALQRVLLSLLFQDLIGSSVNSFDWKSLPGSIILKQMVLTVTADIYRMQLGAMEQSLNEQQSDTEHIGTKENNASKSFAMMLQEDHSISLFMHQVQHLMSSVPSFIHNWMMTIFENTNYMIPHHVIHCLQYLDQLIIRFPAYFQNNDAQGQAGSAVGNTATLIRVFTCLLRSERFDILKHTLLFLLRRFHNFTISLKEQLMELFASQIRLFVHWHRDVRLCYHHVLIYLTYPGNRLVLCAKSDELLMGQQASQMFDIYGLVRRGEWAIKWDQFDQPLTAMLLYVQWKLKQNPTAQGSIKNRSIMATSEGRKSMTILKNTMRTSLQGRPKQTPLRYSLPDLERISHTNNEEIIPQVPDWLADVRFCMIERSVQEYRTHMRSYFQLATQVSIHQAVPTPSFESV